ncbi:uncharacterized protein LOC128855731 isoform X2 [Anastrepha ludens]|uniref:uncharacterized protein LOC128855731 isoform X2 n=1 Tax=Anastrepha ludens TaxID=28586 RepID=UPI0023AEC6A4|nr:uncharacterized protein LOC128855731 isoform X2 [Anastrepha ludens]
MPTWRALFIFGAVVLCCVDTRTVDATPTAIAAAAAASEEPVRRLRKAHKICAQEISPPATDESDNTQIAGAYLRCMTNSMGLWTDGKGYNAKRVAKFFSKQRNENEIVVVVDHCNQQHKQADLNLWAFEAYRCATAGRMGTWLGEYLLSAKI